MGLISLTLPNDGETIDAADVNSPLNTIATAINGNLDNANIKTGAAIDGSKIASASLTATQMADSVSPVKRWDEAGYDFVASGGIWTGDSYGSTRNASMTAGVVYINGERVTVSAVTARTFTASKDTYVDVSSTGALSYTEVANNAASPSLAANSLRLAIVVTGATSIANAYSINQGNIAFNTNTVYLPTNISGAPSAIASSIQDGNGVRIYPTDPLGELVAASSRSASTTTGTPGATSVSWNGMAGIVFQAEPYTNYEVSMREPALSGYSPAGIFVWEFYLATASATYTTVLGEEGKSLSNNDGANVSIAFNSGSYTGKTFLNMKLRSATISGTVTINTDTTRTGVYTIKKL